MVDVQDREIQRLAVLEVDHALLVCGHSCSDGTDVWNTCLALHALRNSREKSIPFGVFK